MPNSRPLPLSTPITPAPLVRSRAPLNANHHRKCSTSALPIHDLVHAAHLDIGAVSHHLSHMFTLGYEPVVLPCSSMNCGDVTYRSTLDPVLRRELRGINPQGVALLAAVGSYLFARPGVLSGLIDMYAWAPLARYGNRPYCKEDFALGRKIASGGFGTVFEATLTDIETGKIQRTIVKKATEFGEAEVWMNERMMRSAPSVIAPFLTGFSEGEGRLGDPLWLVWRYEGASTLADCMARREFPYNLEGLLFERPLNIPEGPDRKAAIIRVGMQQLLQGLEACHYSGIVHRDIKPQNCIVAEADRRIKLIDFGAAADLRIGINYVPNQYLLDPRFAPPQQYVMSAQTPRAPPAPVAALLSPVLWRLNSPDRFDMWSAGVVLLQMALPPLRSDAGLVAFNRALSEQHGWDLNAWRRGIERSGRSKDWVDGFAVLDALDGQGWALATRLVTYRPQDRLSAKAALAHPWFEPSPFDAVASTVESLGRVAAGITEADDGWLGRQMAKSGTREAGGFTEVQLKEEFGGAGADAEELRKRLLGGSATMAWWSQRQGEQAERRRRLGNGAAKKNGVGFVVGGEGVGGDGVNGEDNAGGGVHKRDNGANVKAVGVKARNGRVKAKAKVKEEGVVKRDDKVAAGLGGLFQAALKAVGK